MTNLAIKEDFQDKDKFVSWFNDRREANHFEVKQIPFNLLDQWYFEKDTHNLVHKSGKFFSVEGIEVETNFGSVKNWGQPIINQPEIGILGIITKKVAGIRYFLMQAKMEPGNVNIIQLSPTVQATKSNYTQVHKGKIPTYLEYFIDKSKARVLVDLLQSEQGGRFLRKKNRNIIIEVNHDIHVYDDFYWLTLDQINQLLAIDNFINMDARSVLSGAALIGDSLRGHGLGDFSNSLLDSGDQNQQTCNKLSEINNRFRKLKAKYEIDVKQIPLNKLSQWKRTEWEIAHETKRFFSVIAVLVKAGNREVCSWTQPLLKSSSYGLVGFITKKINNVLHFLIQAKVEPGNFDIVDMAPSVSCSEVELRAKHAEKPTFLDLFINASSDQIRYSAVQSEEGGRFYHFQNRCMIIELNDSTSLEIPENYMWMSLGQMLEFVKCGYFNIEARCLLACVMSLI